MRVLVTLAAVLLLLAGCTPEPVVETAAPSPSRAPVFASEEEALAAAEEAYAAYEEVSDAIAHDGGANPERMNEVASDEFAEDEIRGWQKFADAGYVAVGEAAFDHFSLQAYYSPVEPGPDVIRVYLCSDVSGVDVLNAEGVSVVRPDRPDRTPFEVGFDLIEGGILVIASREVWEGEGVCE